MVTFSPKLYINKYQQLIMIYQRLFLEIKIIILETVKSNSFDYLYPVQTS